MLNDMKHSIMLTENNGSWIPLIVEDKIHKSLTIVGTICYSLIFILAYVQLWLVLYLRHKLLSAQTIYFFLCCIFTSLRIILFSYFFGDIINVETLNHFSYWLLMCLPTLFQYLIVLLITIFYYKTYIKSKGEGSKLTRNVRLMIASSMLVDLALSLIPVWCQGSPPTLTVKLMTSFHIILSDGLFLVTISIFVYVYRQFPKFPNSVLVLEAKKITKTRIVIVTVACLIGVLAKCIYDIIAVIVQYDIFGITLPSSLHQSDFVNLSQNILSFVIFGIVLFLWEIVPLLSVMVLFRVRFPVGFCRNGSHGHSSKGTQGSYSRSHSTSMASSIATRSRFINIPTYGSVNPFVNSSGASSGLNGPPNQKRYPQDRYMSPTAGQSYDTRVPHAGKLRPGTSEGCTIQDDSAQFLNVNTKSTKPLPRIWRSSSHKCLVNTHSKDHVHDPKVCSSRLATANEE